MHPSRIDDPCDALIAQHDAIHGDTGPGTFEEIVVPAIVPKTTTFVEDVVTYLPYIASTRTFSADYTGFMIDQERLVGMKVRSLRSHSRGLTDTLACSQWLLQNLVFLPIVTSIYLCSRLLL